MWYILTELGSIAEFQSTLPVRGATFTASTHVVRLQISIHAPREGSDLDLMRFLTSSRHFNPRSP